MIEGPPARVNFALELTSTGAATVLKAIGEIDASVSGELRDRLAAAIEAGAPVLADLSEVTFCDSTGLTALIHAHRAAVAAGTRFVLVTKQRAVLRPISLLGLAEILEIHPDVEAARTALG
ncbi:MULTISPECIES: STAS domain-containing protein [unclassified Amycolatopsis]|uniref:STAS domain-containing protein n=1 Tax=unclassified Amycolatopsis TaxID=2618356 RepID=UPI002E22B839|nr:MULTISPECIES: STAS domain-containing protein [unclassified Amycolatopsis]